MRSSRRAVWKITHNIMQGEVLAALQTQEVKEEVLKEGSYSVCQRGL